MRYFPITNLSLRTRFLFAMGIVFIPLVVVAVGANAFLGNTAGALNQIVEQPVYKLQATSRLQNQIRKTSALARDFADTRRFAQRAQFETEAAVVETMFVEVLSKPFLGSQEHALLNNARRDWKESTVLADAIFSASAPRAALHQLDQRVNQIMFMLEQAHDIHYSEIGAQRAKINAAENRHRTIIVIAVSVGLLMAVVGAILLARSVLKPLREFEKGMVRFSNDDLSYRLPLQNQDEIGRLAREFNTMAEKLMQQQHKLEELSVRDGLTGLYNRRELEKRLHEEVQRVRRYQRPLSVMMLDIDHFKSVNDRYGHQAGDEVLISVADLIQLNVRPVDLACRYGGEELTVILPETDEQGAHMVAERIRGMVANSITTTPQGDLLQVTVSIGFATFPRHGDTAADLIHAADQALYLAKQEGRNLVRSH